jgi:hypothetical protein
MPRDARIRCHLGSLTPENATTSGKEVVILLRPPREPRNSAPRAWQMLARLQLKNGMAQNPRCRDDMRRDSAGVNQQPFSRFSSQLQGARE